MAIDWMLRVEKKGVEIKMDGTEHETRSLCMIRYVERRTMATDMAMAMGDGRRATGLDAFHQPMGPITCQSHLAVRYSPDQRKSTFVGNLRAQRVSETGRDILRRPKGASARLSTLQRRSARSGGPELAPDESPYRQTGRASRRRNAAVKHLGYHRNQVAKQPPMSLAPGRLQRLQCSPLRLPRSLRVRHAPQRTFINQAPGVQRVMRAQMAQDFKRVKTLVFYPPLIALGYVGIFSITAFIGTQWWIEHVEMAPGDKTPYGWELEMEDWSGGSKGGTDPSLGFGPRIAIRSAWLFQHWLGSMLPGTATESTYLPSTLFNTPDRGYQLAEQQVVWVIRYLRSRNRPVPPAILLRHIDLLEHLGTPEAIKKAKMECLSLYSTLPENSIQAAQLAYRIAGFYDREGYEDGAFAYWTKVSKVAHVDSNSPPLQRLAANLYLQLSSYFSSQGDFREALDVHHKALDLSESAHQAWKLDSSPESTLHGMYLLHRSSVLHLQFAETMFLAAAPPATKRDSKQLRDSAIEAGERALLRAVEDAQRLADALSVPGSDTDTSVRSSGTSSLPVNKSFSQSRSLRRPAEMLLRDARRTVVKGHELKGMSLEVRGDLDKALACYQEALQAAGTTVARGMLLGIPEEEIIALQRRVEEVRSRLDTSRLL